MFMIYWTEDGQPSSKQFESEEMSEALKFSQDLRNRQYTDGSVSFVSMSSENPNCVGKQGVDVTGPDYDWKKRR